MSPSPNVHNYYTFINNAVATSITFIQLQLLIAAASSGVAVAVSLGVAVAVSSGPAVAVSSGPAVAVSLGPAVWNYTEITAVSKNFIGKPKVKVDYICI